MRTADAPHAPQATWTVHECTAGRTVFQGWRAAPDPEDREPVDSRGPFPGGRAGQPLAPGTLRQRFRALGLPTTPNRAAALNQLVLRAHAVIAAALGYGDESAEHHRLAAGGTWSRYPAFPR